MGTSKLGTLPWQQARKTGVPYQAPSFPPLKSNCPQVSSGRERTKLIPRPAAPGQQPPATQPCPPLYCPTSLPSPSLQGWLCSHSQVWGPRHPQPNKESSPHPAPSEQVGTGNHESNPNTAICDLTRLRPSLACMCVCWGGGQGHRRCF